MRLPASPNLRKSGVAREEGVKPTPNSLETRKRVSFRDRRLLYPPIALAVSEKTLLACVPTNRMVPTTMTRMTANITAYSAMSCPSSSDQQLCRSSSICPFLELHLPWNLIVRWEGVTQFLLWPGRKSIPVLHACFE